MQANEHRFIATLDGPRLAPKWMSDDAVKHLNQSIHARGHAPISPVPADRYSGRMPLEGSDVPLFYRGHQSLREARSEGRKSRYQSGFLANCGLFERVRGLEKAALTKRSGKNSSYRISMMVVAIVMVMLLGSAVNRASRHGRPTQEAR